MKKYLLFMTAIMFAVSLSAQYIPLPDSNAVWSVDFVKYSIVGDSTYKSKRYKKIYIANYSYPTIKKVFFALIRQDKPSQKVFVIFKNDPNEKLLYDFSLNTDDIVEVDGHYPYFDYSYHTSKVQIGQIDDVIIDSLPRKRMEIKGVDWMYGAPEYWIEGIGSTLGFLSSGITGIGIFDICYPTLLCLEQDSVITYQDPVVKKCYQKCKPGATGEVPIPEKGKIYPHPASSAISLESADIIEEYSISTISGLPIVHERCGAHKVTANVAGIQNGIYFITIMTKDGISVQKLVIAR